MFRTVIVKTTNDIMTCRQADEKRLALEAGERLVKPWNRGAHNPACRQAQ